MLMPEENEELLRLLEEANLSHFEIRARRLGRIQIDLAAALTKARNGEPLSQQEFVAVSCGFLPGEREKLEAEALERKRAGLPLTRDQKIFAAAAGAEATDLPKHIPQATHLPVSPAPAEKQSESERERQEPSRDGQPGYVDWASRLSPGSTRPSGRLSGRHGWMS